MHGSGSTGKRMGEWERYEAHIRSLKNDAFEAYFARQKETYPDVSKDDANFDYYTACSDFAFALIHDEKVRLKQRGVVSTDHAAQLSLGHSVAWHVLIGSTPSKEDMPGRDIRGEVEAFFKNIVRTGTLPNIIEKPLPQE